MLNKVDLSVLYLGVKKATVVRGGPFKIPNTLIIPTDEWNEHFVCLKRPELTFRRVKCNRNRIRVYVPIYLYLWTKYLEAKYLN